MARINMWALKNYKSLTRETILAIMDEIEAGITGARKPRVLSSPSEVHNLASMFKDILYKYRFFKTKPQRILEAIIDRCGEAYYAKDPMKLYISKEVVEEWSFAYKIPLNKMHEYLRPLLRFNILRQSDRKEYAYKVDDKFFQLIGPVAQYLVVSVNTRDFIEKMAIVSGISSIYVIATSARSKWYGERPLIPWFLKLSMIYTLAGLEPGTIKIRKELELGRINAVDNYFVIERGAPVELWRSIRVEAFNFMTSNNVIKQALPNGYELNELWVRMHEEGVRRYVERYRRRFEERYRGY